MSVFGVEAPMIVEDQCDLIAFLSAPRPGGLESPPSSDERRTLR